MKTKSHSHYLIDGENQNGRFRLGQTNSFTEAKKIIAEKGGSFTTFIIWNEHRGVYNPTLYILEYKKEKVLLTRIQRSKDLIK